VDLFAGVDPRAARVDIAPGALLLPGFALGLAARIEDDLEHLTSVAPFRHMETPGGFRMSVAMTNCGAVGWTTDRRGYRYRPEDPVSGEPWPVMPAAWHALARDAATAAGYARFDPDACLVNEYAVGARMSLHQDRNERDLSQPVVSVSFGLPATFLFGGLARTDRPRRLPLRHGDVVVWGGAMRLAFHGIAPLRDGAPSPLGRRRINLTFRRAL
jgi:alkylated DNA repair protein (DNA oxidative demethylase)